MMLTQTIARFGFLPMQFNMSEYDIDMYDTFNA